MISEIFNGYVFSNVWNQELDNLAIGTLFLIPYFYAIVQIHKPVSEFFTQRFYQIRRNKSENYSFVLLKSAKWTWFHRFKKYSALVLKKNSRNNSLGTLPKFISKVQHRMVLRQIDFWYSTRDSPIDKHHHWYPAVASRDFEILWFLVSFCLGMMHRLWFIRLLVSIVQSDCGFRLIKDEYSDFVVEF